jgi:hypothetical protein
VEREHDTVHGETDHDLIVTTQSTTVADSQPPQKRQRGRFGSIRNRLSVVGTPALDNAQDGRKSSASTMIRDLGQASKGFFGKLVINKSKSMPPANVIRDIVSVLTPILINGAEDYKIRVAFIGDGNCGKTNLLQYVHSNSSSGLDMRD